METSPEYELGFQAGVQYASAPRGARPLAPDRKFIAGITLIMGVGSAAAIVASVSESHWRKAFAAFGIAGVLLSTVLATGRVLNRGPAPWEL